MLQNLIGLLILFSFMSTQVIFDFTNKSDIHYWRIVDDVVMGGKSSGNFHLNVEGHGVFFGKISLENNGGFSSVRYRSDKILTKNHTKISVKLKGDGKKYQIRIKAKTEDYFSYVMPFSTSGEWQEIEIALKDMYPTFRGRRLDKPNFSNEYFEEIAFLIGNKRKEDFKLIIDKIELK